MNGHDGTHQQIRKHDDLFCDLNNARNNDLFTDVCFRCNGNVDIHLHKLFLGAKSRFLCNMLMEQDVVDDNPVIILPDYDAEVVYLVTAFIYTGEIICSSEQCDQFLSIMKDLRIGAAIVKAKLLVKSEKDCDNYFDTDDQQGTSPIETQLQCVSIQNADTHEPKGARKHQLDCKRRISKIPNKRKVQKQRLSNKDNDLQCVSSSQSERGVLTEISDNNQSLVDLSKSSAAANRAMKDKALRKKKLPKNKEVSSSEVLMTVNGPFRCKFCNVVSSTALLHGRHENRCKKIKKFKIFVDSESGEKTFVCVTCGAQYTSQASFWRHAEIHREKCSCPICGKLFFRSRLNSHMVSHSEERPFVCSVCGNAFRRNCQLSRHIATMHSATTHPENQLKCQYCDKAFICDRDVKHHVIKAHTRDFPYHCEFCQRGFVVQGFQLRNHTAACSDNPNRVPAKRYFPTGEFKCNICNYICPTKPALVRHDRVHSGERPYVCEKCGMQFKLPEHLRIHSLRHKPFVEVAKHCEHCSKRFLTAGNLRQHIITMHTKDYRHRCVKCHKGFIKPKVCATHTKSCQVATPQIVIADQMQQCDK